MVAHTTIVLTRYMMLAVESRSKEDSRTLGELFFIVYDELQDIQFVEGLASHPRNPGRNTSESLFLTDEQVSQLVEMFVLKLPEYLSKKLGGKKASY